MGDYPCPFQACSPVQVGSICLSLNRMTNNQAEYFGLIAGLQAASYMGITRLVVKGDSELVIKQVCSQTCHALCGRVFASCAHSTCKPPACHQVLHCKHCFQACHHVLGKLAQARCSSCTLQPAVLLQVQLHLQVNGVYQVNNQLLRKLYLQVIKLRRQFQVFSISHVLR